MKQYLNISKHPAILLLLLVFPLALLSQGIESSVHIALDGGRLVPQKRSTVPVFQLDFAKPGAKWEKVENHENRLETGYGEKLGQTGFYLAGRDKGGDTAWQLWSAKFPVQGVLELTGTVAFHSNCGFPEVFTPYRKSYVNSVFWFAADGAPLGRTAFPVVVPQAGHTPVAFRMTVPRQAAQASLSLGADSPNLKAGDILLISRITLDGVPAQGGAYCTDAEAILPPVRFAPCKTVCTFTADTPNGTAVIVETAFAIDSGGAPAEFSEFGPINRPIPEGTAWVKCRVRFQSDGTACPALRSVTVCGRTFADWTSTETAARPLIRRREDMSTPQELQQTVVKKPVIRRLSQSPSANPTQPFVFSVTHDMPINWRTLKVILDKQEITTLLQRTETAAPPPILESTTFTYVPTEPFAMRTVHKAVITLSDIYGHKFSRTLYFFFDEPLEKGVVTLRDDGQLLLDGQPFFPICAPYIRPFPENDNNLDTAFTRLKEAGFNCTTENRVNHRSKIRGSFASYMDKVAEHGFKIYVAPGNTNGANCKDIDAILKTVVAEYRHPALLAWYIGDDTLTHNTPEQMELKLEAIRAVDPYHPTRQADAVFSFYPSIYVPVATEDDASRYRPVVNFTDMFSPELYPVRNFSKENAMDCVPSVIADMKTIWRDVRDQATSPKFIWGTVQYFEGWQASPKNAEWKRYPTWQELRAMTWATLIHGSRGISWYTYGYQENKFAHGFLYKEETRSNMKRMSLEVAGLSEVLVERADGPAPAITILDGPAKDALQNDSISVMARKHGGSTYIFAVNSAFQPVKARIAAPGLSKGTVLYENDRPAPVADASVLDVFQPYEVHIYKLK